MGDHRIERRLVDRRGLLGGLSAAGVAAVASPALAQLPGGFSLPSIGGQDINGLVGQVAGVLGNMQFTEADEIAMGQNYYDRFIDQSGGVYNSRVDQEALRDFARPVFATSKRPGLPWDIVLIDNDTVNAWALPGGKVAVHKGLLRYVATPEELAAVLSHEAGHARRADHRPASHGAGRAHLRHDHQRLRPEPGVRRRRPHRRGVRHPRLRQEAGHGVL